MSGQRRRRYGGAAAVSVLSSSTSSIASSSQGNECEDDCNFDAFLQFMTDDQQKKEKTTIKDVMSKPKSKGKAKLLSGPKKRTIVGKNQKKRQREAQKQAKRKKVADELRVDFKHLPMEDSIEAIENQAMRHCSSIKAVGQDLEQLVGEAGHVAIATQSIIEQMKEKDKRQYGQMLKSIETQLDKLSRLAESLKEQQNIIATRQSSLTKRQTEVEERTRETQNNIILIKLSYGALQQQVMTIASQTACGNPSYITKVNQSGMTLLPTALY